MSRVHTNHGRKKRSPLFLMFATLYGLSHLVFLVALTFLSVIAKMEGAEYSFVLIVISLLGTLSGYWMLRGKYNVVKRIGIGISMAIFTALIVAVIFVFPKIPDHAPASIEEDVSGVNQRLFDAVIEKDLSAVESALDSGANILTRNETGQTVLHVVGSGEVAELLVVRGADVNAEEADTGMTPLYFHDLEIGRILIQSGADIHHVSKEGNTPLQWYAYSNYTEGILYLLKLGADPNHVNADGNTAYDIAAHFGHLELSQRLKKLQSNSEI